MRAYTALPRWTLAAALAAGIAAPWPARAQDTEGAARTQRIVDLAGIAPSPAANTDRSFGNRQIYGKSPAAGVGLSIA